MTTYEQKYGRLPDGLADLEEPPEDWQFETPLVSVSMDGNVKSRLPKTFARAQAKPPKMRPISEILGKEDTSMKFANFDLDKQATLVADEYNKKTTITEIREKFDINVYKLYKLLDHAKSMGISVTMRGSCAPQPKLVAPAKKQDPVVSKEAIKDSGHRREFETGAVRDTASGKGRYDRVPWVAIDELAKHCEQGATKYGERNCEKGIPVSSLIDSAFRHLSKYMQGAKDEPHLRAALWNIAFAVYHEKVTPEMQDIPSRQ